mgnify:CR=1 FL=1
MLEKRERINKLQTEINKYNKLSAFLNTAQYGAIDQSTGAGAAVAEAYRSYLGKQRSYAVDLRYDLLPNVALKGEVKYVIPTELKKGPKIQYLYRQAVANNIWVYRLSLDFVF